MIFIAPAAERFAGFLFGGRMEQAIAELINTLRAVVALSIASDFAETPEEALQIAESFEEWLESSADDHSRREGSQIIST